MIFVNSNGKYAKKNSNPYTVYPVDAFRQTLKDCRNKKTIFKYLSGFFYIYTHNEASMDDSEPLCFIATREELAKSCRIDVRSVDKYNDILTKNKIIYARQLHYSKQLPNVYVCGLYEDKDTINSYCNDYLNNVKNSACQSDISKSKGSKK